MNDHITIERKREIVEAWVTNLYPYITKKAIEDKLKLGKDAFYKYKKKNRKFPDKETIKIYDFLKRKALIRIYDIEEYDDD